MSLSLYPSSFTPASRSVEQTSTTAVAPPLQITHTSQPPSPPQSVTAPPPPSSPMPAQKRSHDATAPDDHCSPHQDDNQDHPEQQPEDNSEDSDGSISSADGSRNEFVTVKLTEVRKEVQCPICLGIIRKTRTVMECLHRFCRECIDKSMRLGNNECPACRTHCASRRSLRDDPNYDALIAVLYPDIDKYEAEELAFHEEEKARNKQIQASIAQTLRLQSEALGRKRTTAKATAAAFMRRSRGNYRNLRGRKNQRATEFQESDIEDDNGDDVSKDSSSSDEPCAEVKPKRYKRWGGAQFSQSSLAASSAEGGGDKNELEVIREMVGAAAGLVGSSEMLGWGRGGMRSNTRHGSLSAGNGKNARNSRLSKLLIYHLKNLQQNEEFDIQLKLISMDEKAIPNLEQPYFCCSPAMTIKHLCRLVAIETALEADEVEIVLVKDAHVKVGDKIISTESDPFAPVNSIISQVVTVDPLKDELQVLKDHETLTGVRGLWDFSQHGLLLAYRKKLSGNVSL